MGVCLALLWYMVLLVMLLAICYSNSLGYVLCIVDVGIIRFYQLLLMTFLYLAEKKNS